MTAENILVAVSWAVWNSLGTVQVVWLQARHSAKISPLLICQEVSFAIVFHDKHR